MKNSKVKYRLKGHGTFVIREGWISKALYYVSKDNSIFKNKQAADVLGVGNNMAQSIRYWLKATELMKESSVSGAKLTPLGEMIYKNDPYLEDIFSLWIMHSNLVRNKEVATSWYLFFNRCEAEEYVKDEIIEQLKKELRLYINDDNFSETSLHDDVIAICNMYGKTKERGIDPEDNRISPFAELKLLQNKNEKFTKTQPNIHQLDEKVVLYVLLRQMNTEESISIDELIEGTNSIGKTLNLNRIMVNQYLDKLDEQGYIRINRTAGLDIVYRKSDVSVLEVVQSYYTNTGC